MTQTNRFALMLEALTELVAEEKNQHTGSSKSARNKIGNGLPSLKDVLSSAGPVPGEALFLGLAEDGLTVLLNLYDPIPGPLFITGDSASGKTALLQVIARAIELMHSPSEVEFGVLTASPNDWDELRESRNLAGVYSTHDGTAKDLLSSLVGWAHHNKGENQSVILLIDDLESATQLSNEAEQNLRWLLLRGPSRRVWPIVTLNASRAKNLEAWLGFFRTRLFGHIQSEHDAELLTGLPGHSLDYLTAGTQFTMREGNNWLNFWIPKID
jgi:hypothetical protein